MKKAVGGFVVCIVIGLEIGCCALRLGDKINWRLMGFASAHDQVGPIETAIDDAYWAAVDDLNRFDANVKKGDEASAELVQELQKARIQREKVERHATLSRRQN